MTQPTRYAAISFEHIVANEPDFEALAQQAQELEALLASAKSIDVCMPALDAWDETRSRVETYANLVNLRFEQDTRDAARKAAREDWDRREPRWTELQVDLSRKLLAHPLRAEFERSIGSQAFALWESRALAFDAAIKADLALESQLGAEYTELMASAEIEFDGEKHSLSTILKYRQRAQREVRHAAERALWCWFEANGATLDRIYDELVQLRARMAQTLGCKNFVDVGYKRKCRVDYGREDVERFRDEIVNVVVPLCSELHARQTRALGVDRLMAWDEPVHDLRGNPTPNGDRAWMVERSREMFHSMAKGLGEFFERLAAGDFLDLDSRQGKAGGGFCTSFPDYGMPFVFANFNGTLGDVRVLTHEVGHAFQNYSSRNLKPLDYHWPTSESAEIHSMSLEFLTHPFMDAFFGADAERFRRVHMTQALLFLPYGTAVDHFQHLVYERPTATPAERHEMWLEMERRYLPWRQWGDLDYPAKGGRWQHQLHIYVHPFYYIDYVLAQSCALQYWAWAERDRPAALESYVQLCGRGGSAPFQALVRDAGLVSPFEAGCLSDVVHKARELLLTS